MWRLMHAAPIRTQLALVLATIPIVVALFGALFARVAIDIALDGSAHALATSVTQAVRVALALTVAFAAMAAGCAALLVRGSLRTIIERMHAATWAIADGDFSHRVGGRARRDELGQLAHAIDVMAMRLEQLEHARRRLLACVSHELRTPLTIIRGHAYTLGRDESDTFRRDRLQLIESESVRLAALVDELLDAATLHAGGVKLHRERCDLRDVVSASVERMTSTAAESAISLEISMPTKRCEVDADLARLQQVMANLLGNAVRHAPRASAVEITVSHGASLVIEVSNHANAIPPAIAATLFEPFVQHGVDPGGVGLGLSIARDLVDAHGGALTLSERGESGLVTFRVELPKAARRQRSELTGRFLVQPRTASAEWA
ncbi:MAG: two-component system sensor kinase [Thermoleophilia bacterium]|nr:two-component system sensor kinase [Thermoleophilia bacterium]